MLKYDHALHVQICCFKRRPTASVLYITTCRRVQTVLHRYAAIRSSHQFSGHLIYTFQFPHLVISTLLSITLQGLLLLCNVFACHKFSILSVRQDTDPFIALLCSFLFLLFLFLFYCGTKNVKAVKGCSVFTNHFLV